jgi:phenol/toluene 2-monooxygenase (NADH) P4/A4
MAFGEVKALYKYEFEPRDRAEVFGDDLIVYAYWIDNRFFCSASAWRVPKI